MQAALEKEYADTEASATAAGPSNTNSAPPISDSDQAMGGTDDVAETKEDDDEASDAGSEDLEAESSESDDEEDEEEGGEGEAEAEGGEDQEMDMGDDGGKPSDDAAKAPMQQKQGPQEVMAH